MRRGLANLLFLFLGLPLALSSLLLVSARPWALDRETYRRWVEDDRLYSALQAPEIASRAPETIELQAAGQKLVFDGPALTAAAQKDLPWPAIKATAAKATDAVLDAVEGRSPGGRVELDLRPLKAALVAAAPAAGRDYAAALAARGGDAALASGGGDAAAGTALVPAKGAAGVLAQAARELPDEAVSEPLGQRQMRRAERSLPVGVLSRGEALTQAALDRATWSMLAASALLLTGLAALGGRDLASRLERAGKYLMPPSVIVLALGAILAIPGGLILQNVLPAEARAMLEGQAGAQLRAYLASALGPIARDFFLTGLVGASLGGLLGQARRIIEPKLDEIEEKDD